jgi:inner centromere protein
MLANLISYSGTALKVALINQHCHPPDFEKLFGRIDPPDLNEVFAKKKPRFNKRTSSAVWDVSVLLPRTPDR